MNNGVMFMSRLQAYQKKVMKYVRYMLNDHFLIVGFFLLGFVLVQYSLWLRTIRVLELPLLVFLSVVLAFVPFVGRLATMMEEADAQFLPALGQNFKPYLFRAQVYSWILPVITSVLSAGVVYPIFLAAYGNNVIPFLSVLFTLLVNKAIDFARHRWYMEGRLQPSLAHVVVLYVVNVASLLAVMMGIDSVMALIAPVVLVVWLVVCEVWMSRMPIFYAWQYMVSLEQERQQQIFRVIGLFVDVPYLKRQGAKRRAALDGIVKALSPISLHPYRYLLARNVVRSSNYIPLVVQMSVLTVIIALLSPAWYWTLVMNGIIMMVIAFQFGALYRHPKENLIYVHGLFPQKERLDDFMGIVYPLLMVTSVLLVVISTVASGQVWLLSGLIVYPAISVAFGEYYLRRRVTRKKKVSRA